MVLLSPGLFRLFLGKEEEIIFSQAGNDLICNIYKRFFNWKTPHAPPPSPWSSLKIQTVHMMNWLYFFIRSNCTYIPPPTPLWWISRLVRTGLKNIGMFLNVFQPISGVTVLLTLTVFSIMVNEMLPRVSDAVPIIG